MKHLPVMHFIGLENKFYKKIFYVNSFDAIKFFIFYSIQMIAYPQVILKC